MQPFFRSALLFVFPMCFSQNLVKNPSFEQTKRCSSFIGAFNVSVLDWSAPTFGSTDLFSTCAEREQNGIPANFIGIQTVEFGQNYAGFYLFTETHYREYIQGQLSEPLIPGQRYRFSFWVSLAEAADYGLKEFGVALTENKVQRTHQSNITEGDFQDAKAGKTTQLKIVSDQPIGDKESWTAVSTTFTADGSERFFIIGNFENNRKTEKVLVDKKRLEIAYYFIDMVSLEAIDDGDLATNDTNKNDGPEIFADAPVAEKRYILQNVNFAFDRYDLDDAAVAEITRLFDFLKAQNFPLIVLSGHTDDKGSDEYNREISQKRAQSVADFLVGLGYDPTKVEATGFGETQPIDDNASDEGRRRNRRVEFQIKG